MWIGSVFASKDWRASDPSGGAAVRLTMAAVRVEVFGGAAEKPVLCFAGSDKGLVLNRTNASTIS
jgi:hypothetical protein